MTVPAPPAEGRTDLLDVAVIAGIILIAAIVILSPHLPYNEGPFSEFFSGPFVPGAGLLAVRVVSRCLPV